MELSKEDWERVKKSAEAAIKEALLMQQINSLILEKAEKELKKYGTHTIPQGIG
jgi:hypothetical protein